MNSCSDLKSIGKRIRELREKSNLTQEELSKKLNIQREKLAKMETGRQDFKTQDIISIADIFNVSCDYILRGVSAENIEINKDLGLSETAISVLKNKSKDYLKIVNALLNEVAIKDDETAIKKYEQSVYNESIFDETYCIPSVLMTIYKYLSILGRNDSVTNDKMNLCITRNGLQSIKSIEESDKETILKCISNNRIAENILFDDICIALKRLKRNKNLVDFEFEDIETNISFSDDENGLKAGD